MRRWLPLLALLALSACRDSGSGPPVTTTTLLPETTVTQPATTTTLGFDIPAVIDLPYVQRVLETIYHLDGEAARYIYAKKLPDAHFNERLEAIFGDPRLSEAKQVYGENAAQAFVRFANPPGDPSVRAIEIIDTSDRCMIIRVDLDYGPQYKDPPPRRPTSVVQLSRADVLPLNPTGWGIIAAGTPQPDQDLRKCR